MRLWTRPSTETDREVEELRALVRDLWQWTGSSSWPRLARGREALLDRAGVER